VSYFCAIRGAVDPSDDGKETTCQVPSWRVPPLQCPDCGGPLQRQGYNDCAACGSCWSVDAVGPVEGGPLVTSYTVRRARFDVVLAPVLLVHDRRGRRPAVPGCPTRAPESPPPRPGPSAAAGVRH
jgi:hypothetical protein